MIIPDSHEPSALRFALASLAETAKITIEAAQQLPWGDFWLIPRVDTQLIVERKKGSDLQNSIADGRFFRQLANCLQGGTETILLIEGDLFPKVTGGIGARPGVHPNAIRGAILSAEREGVRVVQSRDALDSARALIWLYQNARVPHKSWSKGDTGVGTND